MMRAIPMVTKKATVRVEMRLRHRGTEGMEHVAYEHSNCETPHCQFCEGRPVPVHRLRRSRGRLPGRLPRHTNDAVGKRRGLRWTA